jgi:tetratricopeptide (TPR) repeat protein
MQMELLESLAIMSEGLGQYHRADSLIHSAREVGEQLYGLKDPRTLQTRVRHAGLLIIRDSAAAAEGELRDVIASVSQSDAGHPVHSEAYFAMGRMLRVVGRSEEGLAALRSAVEVRGNRDTLSLPFVEALRELGNAAAAGGKWSLADSAWKRALPIAQRVLGPGHPQTSFLLTNLGNGASQLGDLARAEGHLRSSVDVMRDWYGSDHYLTAATQYVLTQTLVRQRKYTEAGPLIEHVIEVYAKSPLLGPRSPNYALAVGLQGTVFDKVGEHAKARERFVRAAELLQSSWGNEHKDVLHFEASAALTLVFAGQGDSAVALLEDIASRADLAHGRRSLPTAQIHAQLATALVSVRRYADVVRVSEPAIQVMDSVLGGVRPVSYPLREDLALAYDALGDSTRASAVRRILQAKE